MLLCMKVSKCAECVVSRLPSPPSAGDLSHVRATDICVFVEFLLCGEHFALGYHIVEDKPLADGAYNSSEKNKK